MNINNKRHNYNLYTVIGLLFFFSLGAMLSCVSDASDAGGSDGEKKTGTLGFNFFDLALPTDTGLYWGETAILQPLTNGGEKVNKNGWSYRVTRDGRVIYAGADTQDVRVEATGTYKGFLNIQFTDERDKYNGYVAQEYRLGSTLYSVEVSGTGESGTEYSGRFDYALPNVGFQFRVHSYDETSKGYELSFRFIPSFKEMFAKADFDTFKSATVYGTPKTATSDAQLFTYKKEGDTIQFTEHAPQIASSNTNNQYYKIAGVGGVSAYDTVIDIRFETTNQSDVLYKTTYRVSITEGNDAGSLVGQSFVLPVANLMKTLDAGSQMTVTVNAGGVEVSLDE